MITSWSWLTNGRIWAGLGVVAALVISHATAFKLGGAGSEVKLAKTESAQAATNQTRAEAARVDEQQTTVKEHKHAGLTLAAVERYSYSTAGAELVVRAQLADAQRLRSTAEARASRYHAQAQLGAEACRALADRASALDSSLAEGREVVAELRGALVRRDFEVAFLLDLADSLYLLTEAP